MNSCLLIVVLVGGRMGIPLGVVLMLLTASGLALLPCALPRVPGAD
jgi:hypothetical protein